MIWLCGESEDLSVIMGHFPQVGRRDLKVNVDESKVILLDMRDWNMSWMGCDWSMSECKYLGCVVNESGTDDAVS